MSYLIGIVIVILLLVWYMRREGMMSYPTYTDANAAAELDRIKDKKGMTRVDYDLAENLLENATGGADSYTMK